MNVSGSLVRIGVLSIFLSCTIANAEEKSLRLKFPKRTKPTPVQQLNRDGVKAIKKHEYDKAKKLFYRAYLLDPNDPFTLNNLGYIAELEGEIERAQRYYDLAAQNGSDAVVDTSNTEEVEGRPVASVAGTAEDRSLQVNKLNIQALGLLSKDRAPEADIVLQQALILDRNNPFTLNNLGYAKEKQGEFEAALNYYTAAARLNSDEPIVVAFQKRWRGRPISQVAEDNADKLRSMMRKGESVEAKVARLNLQGVSALNRNDRATARKCFQEAHKLDDDYAFTLNNLGYMAEIDGDRETAEFYYQKAREAYRSGRQVAVATRRDAEGQPLQEIASLSEERVQARMMAEIEARRRARGEIFLKTRDRQRAVPKPLPKPEDPSADIRFGSPSADSGIPAGTAQQSAPGSQQPQPDTATPAVAQPPERLAPEYDIATPDDTAPPR